MDRTAMAAKTEGKGVLSLFRGIAFGLGYCLCLGGWGLFGLVAFGITMQTVLDAAPLNSGDAESARYGLLFCGYAIVPGWLLLRFAADLFPFRRRLFKYPK